MRVTCVQGSQCYYVILSLIKKTLGVSPLDLFIAIIVKF